ncbi:MAG TPA: hypothetical protein DDW51_00485 [Cyanobacteria bacterium UBA11367]|nr:hypothetical protein [Cyanobacteria bacterium UBA11367]
MHQHSGIDNKLDNTLAAKTTRFIAPLTPQSWGESEFKVPQNWGTRGGFLGFRQEVEWLSRKQQR